MPAKLLKWMMTGAVAAGTFALASAAMAQSAPAGDGLLAKLRKAGVVRIGMVNSPPYGTLDPDGTVGGLGPTVVKTIMARLGVPKVEGIVAPYGQLIPGLMAGRWDIIGATMTITPVRCEQVTFADPEFVEGVGFAYIPSELPNPPKSMKEMGEQIDRIGLQQGTAELPVVQKAVTAGRNGTILQFPDNAALLDGLMTKRAQMILSGVIILRREQTQVNHGFEIIYPMPGDTLRGQGAAFRPGDKDLIEPYQAEIRKMKASGEMAKLVTGYGFDVLPGSMEMTNEQACKID